MVDDVDVDVLASRFPWTEDVLEYALIVIY